MEALFVVLAVFVLLAFPIWTLVLLHRIRREQDHHQVLLDGALSRLDRLASRPAAGEPESRPSPASQPPAPRPAAPPAPASVPPPPVSATPPPAPPPPPPPRPAPIPAFAAEPPESSEPSASPPSPLQEKTQNALRRIWNWIAINEDFRPAGVSWEFAVATTWLLRLAVVIFVVGIGFFLKYSIDKGILGPHARVVLSTATGVAMLAVGSRLLGKAYHLLGQGLLGGGFAVLYFSAFASHQFYHLVDAVPAFGLMALVTLVAGVFSVRFNSLLVAVLGILGGFSTPVLLSNGPSNLVALFSYLLLLGLGVLGISLRRQWPLLNYLAMLLAYGIAALAVDDSAIKANFPVLMPFLCAFFLLFAASMFLYNLSRRVKASLLEILGVLANAAIFFSLGRHVAVAAFSPRAAAVLALALAAFHVALVFRFLSARRQDRGLLMAFIALAAFFAVMVPPLAISKSWITLSWSLQGLVMLWLAAKLDSRFLRGLSLGAYALAFARLLFFDFDRQYAAALPSDLSAAAYLSILANRLFALGGPIASLGGAWFLLKRPPAPAPGFRVDPSNDLRREPGGRPAAVGAATVAVAALFLLAHLEIHRTCSFFYAPLALPAMSVAWLALGAFLAHLLARNGSAPLRTLLGILAAAFVAKLLFVDASVWSPDLERLRYGPAWSPLLSGIRSMDYALCIGLLAMLFSRFRRDSASRSLAVSSGVASLVLLFLFLSFEVNTALHRFLPGMRAGGLTLLWALYALALLLAGLRFSVRGFRYAGLALFAVAVAKVFFLDLAGLDPIYRIFAFIVLGVVLFLAALLYLRNRSRFQSSAP